MASVRRILTCILVLFCASLAHAQAYTSIVVIGDSLSDTGNDTHVSTAAYTAAAAVPAPASDYTQGSFTDGSDTLPPATLYKGVWIAQLAAALAAKPPVVDSLDGGTNYAYGFAFTGSGTTPFTYGPGNALSFPVNNMGLQLSTYLATKPVINSKTLFVIWGGANDLLNATASTQVTTAATNELGIIQTLITAGATDFIVVNLPPLGAVPRPEHSRSGDRYGRQCLRRRLQPGTGRRPGRAARRQPHRDAPSVPTGCFHALQQHHRRAFHLPASPT